MTSSFFWTSPWMFSLLASLVPSTVAQRALADGMADGLAGAGDDFDQQAQLGGDGVVLALFFNQMLGQADAFHKYFS